MSLLTTPRTWVAAEIVTAAEMNAEIRDAFTGLQSAWASYTPTLTAVTTNPTLGTGSAVSGAWMQVGKMIHFRVRVTCGSSGTAAGSGTYRISLPIAAKAGTAALGHGIITDGVGGAAIAAATKDGSTETFNMWGAASTTIVNQATYNVIANREYIFTGCYEAA